LNSLLTSTFEINEKERFVRAFLSQEVGAAAEVMKEGRGVLDQNFWLFKFFLKSYIFGFGEL
jgi:hypothetical protein